MLYVTGRLGNCLKRNGNVFVVSSEDANFLSAAMADTHCDEIYREAAAGTDRRIYSDQSLPFNGGFETSTLSGWSSLLGGSGTVTETIVGAEVHSGTKAMKCLGGTGFAEGYQNLPVVPGERLRYDVWMARVTAGTARLRFYNPDTNKYWVSGAWQTTPGDAETHATATYTNKANNITMEPLSVIQRPETTLRIIGRHDNSSGYAVFDDMRVFPHTNLLAVFGHNLGDTVLKWQSSDDGSSWADVATLTPKRPGFYSYQTTALQKRFIGLRLEGTGTVAHYIGELISAYAITPGRAMKWNFQTPHAFTTIHHESALGRPWVARVTEEPARGLSFNVRAGLEADANEYIEDFWARAQGGEWPTLVVPLESESVIYHGRVLPALDPTRAQLTSWMVPLELTPSPMPIVGLGA